MIRNILIAAVIGALATFLPFWNWGTTLIQAVGALALGVDTFILLLGTERRKRDV